MLQPCYGALHEPTSGGRHPAQRKLPTLGSHRSIIGVVLLCTLTNVSAIEPVTMIALSRTMVSAVLKSSETLGYGIPLGGSSRVCYKNGVTVVPKKCTDLLFVKTRATRMRVAKLMGSGLLLQTLVTWFFLAEEQGVLTAVLISDIMQTVISDWFIYW